MSLTLTMAMTHLKNTLRVRSIMMHMLQVCKRCHVVFFKHWLELSGAKYYDDHPSLVCCIFPGRHDLDVELQVA